MRDQSATSLNGPGLVRRCRLGALCSMGTVSGGLRCGSLTVAGLDELGLLCCRGCRSGRRVWGPVGVVSNCICLSVTIA